ncbi:MAG: riboflavin biosynthesis protein RibD [Pseudomonadota bacterium]|jgi:diaminohydroxyphosphoribosylaminopyrimidine deaminase/5-amino-6-(5-phosphoribosylamino)uracil reductase
MTSPPAFTDSDHAHMQAALGLAARGLGRVWPNPSVGCVVVKDGRVVGRGHTGVGGRPHGETIALAQAGAAARGATVYVSLEPCNHHGKTPPCTEALMAAGVARVVIACQDPDPRVHGSGIQRLRDAGIRVDTGLMEGEAAALNEGFFRRIREGRPLVTLKLATSLDGRIATAAGESQWITGPVARAWTHGLRARHDAILVGIGTALADDPELTCRLPGLEGRSPVRVVADSRLRLPVTSRLVRGAGTTPLWIACLPGSGDPDRRRALTDAGAVLLEIAPGPDGRLPVTGLLAALAARGITRVMAEGGAALAASLLTADRVDRLDWFRAGIVLGGDGLPAAQPLALSSLAAAPRFIRTDLRLCGPDQMESWARQAYSNAW